MGMPVNVQPEETALEKENRALKQQVDALERALSEQSANNKPVERTTPPAPWWQTALFMVLLVASVAPSYFVIQERWLANLISIKSVDEIWWNTPALKELAYPRYFLIIFIATVLSALIVLFWHNAPQLVFSNLSFGILPVNENEVSPRQYRLGRYLLIGALVITNISAGYIVFQGRIPGWELLVTLLLYIVGWLLMSYPIGAFSRYIQERGRFLLDAIIFVIALCSVLYVLFGEDQPNYIVFLLFFLAGINFLRHRKWISPLFWISVASLVALTWHIDGWEYVVIGDEYSFYNEVRNILDNRTAWDLINTTFNGNFVYGTHPYFSSYIHDFFMKLFDNHNFGWRFSNPFLVACSLFFFYYFFQTLITRRTALITVILLGFSHYLLSFSKIGYNNLQALFMLGLVLATLAWALRSMKLIAFVLLGLAVGMCFYVYPAALYITPLPVLGLLIFLPPKNRDALIRWGWMIVSIALLFYPLLAQPKYWEAKIPGTFLYTNASDSAGALIHNMSLNMLYSALSFLYAPEQSHYVSTGYMDPVSGVFVVIGFAYLVRLALQRNRSALFLGLTFLFMFFIVGTTHERNFPTATRMFLLLPWFALFAAFGLEWCAENADRLLQANQKSLVNLATVMIVLVNLYQTYTIDIQNMAQYHTLAPMFVKTVRAINANPQMPPKSYAFVAPPGWDTSGLAIIQRAYLVPDSPRQLMDLPLEGNQLPASAADLVTQRDIVVIVKADIDPAITAQVDTQLQTWGKFMCEVRNGKGALQFQLWHSGDLAWLCQ